MFFDKGQQNGESMKWPFDNKVILQKCQLEKEPFDEITIRRNYL